MQTHELRYFLAAARTLNFTKAAALCSISQPALTRAIKKLETELGGDLFVRRPGQMELSRLGRELLPRLEAIERGLVDVRSHAKTLTDSHSRRLRLGVMCTVGPTHLVDILGRLRAKVSDLDVSIRDANSEAVIDMVIADEIDVGITAYPQIPDTIGAQPLLNERFAVAFPEGHSFTASTEVKLSQLNGVSYLERLSCEFDDFFEAAHGEWPIELDVRFSSEREDWIQALILAGHGCAIVPENMQCAPGVLTRPLVEPDVVRTISLINMRGRPLSDVAQAFVRLAAAHRWSGRQHDRA